ncbi:hypothetical protein FIBSPDRAFT_907633 [Athelia psychrophila]|uniref:Ig-like domain-containing protein n=1 Tax=Athelia psychrophila TaxID=1759441 RepID=A0A166U7S3_9AGAM|nr:hypothetical protein FIBSPDRAFT_907633 [Fibularhizoctonia sp. CBS 109695]
MGSHKPGPQYQQHDGNQENITIIVTVCTKGTSTPPTIIFKGKGYQTEWKHDNPANASISCSVKGWTNGAIGIEWIKDFDRHTAVKAKDGCCLLLVDGNNSHYTCGFLEYT